MIAVLEGEETIHKMLFRFVLEPGIIDLTTPISARTPTMLRWLLHFVSSLIHKMILYVCLFVVVLCVFPLVSLFVSCFIVYLFVFWCVLGGF